MAITTKDRQRIAAVFSGACNRKKLCLVKDIMASFSDKWSVYTILLLGQHQKMRFNELKIATEGISQRMLSVTLHSLQENGIIVRLVSPDIPLRMEYRLTELGESLLKQILQLANWAEGNFESIIKARKNFEKAG